MNDNDTKTNTIKEEFQSMAQNLRAVIQSAWESEERKQVQQDLTEGLDELNRQMSDLLTSLRESEAGQKVLQGIDQVGESVRSGEIAEKTQESLAAALRKVNQELSKAADKMAGSKKD